MFIREVEPAVSREGETTEILNKMAGVGIGCCAYLLHPRLVRLSSSVLISSRTGIELNQTVNCNPALSWVSNDVNNTVWISARSRRAWFDEHVGTLRLFVVFTDGNCLLLIISMPVLCGDRILCDNRILCCGRILSGDLSLCGDRFCGGNPVLAFHEFRAVIRDCAVIRFYSVARFFLVHH